MLESNDTIKEATRRQCRPRGRGGLLAICYVFVKIVDMGYRHTSVVVCSILRYRALKGFVRLKRESVFEWRSETVLGTKNTRECSKIKAGMGRYSIEFTADREWHEGRLFRLGISSYPAALLGGEIRRWRHGVDQGGGTCFYR